MGAFFQDLIPEIKVTVAENSERHSMTQHISTNKMCGLICHIINTMFCLLSVSCLVGELFLLTHDRYANSMYYKQTIR